MKSSKYPLAFTIIKRLALHSHESVQDYDSQNRLPRKVRVKVSEVEFKNPEEPV